MRIAFFGSSLVSAYWNGAATYYRGIVRALWEKGHHVTFFEPDAYGRQEHRDIPDPEWAKVVVWENTLEGMHRAIESARNSDLIIKASGVGVFDAELEEAVASLRHSRNLTVFWDVDAPATLERLDNDPSDPFRQWIPRFDAVFTYGGGSPVCDAYERLGAKKCQPIYNAFDPSTHHPVEPEARFTADLGFLGNRLPDREARVEEFFLHAAEACPDGTFLIGGSGWADKKMPENVRQVGHVYTQDHNAFNVTLKAILNISRDSMARYGFSPATRVFEAAGAAACMITDHWEGIEQFFEPGQEILVAHNGDEVAEYVRQISPQAAREVGRQALRRALSHHTYRHRIYELEQTLDLLTMNGKAVAL